jgi:hypothetical protein
MFSVLREVRAALQKPKGVLTNQSRREIVEELRKDEQLEPPTIDKPDLQDTITSQEDIPKGQHKIRSFFSASKIRLRSEAYIRGDRLPAEYTHKKNWKHGWKRV